MKCHFLTIALILCQTYSFASGQVDVSWVGKSKIKTEDITLTLNLLQALDKKDAARIDNVFKRGRGKLPEVGQCALDFLRITILVRLEKFDEALDIYKNFTVKMKDSEYGISSECILIDSKTRKMNKEEKEEVYDSLLANPNRKCWFLNNDKWISSSIQDFCLAEIVKLRGQRLSFRFFQFIRSYSFFPRAYSYLFILIVLSFAIRVLALPLDFNAIKEEIKINKIQAQIDLIRMKRSYLSANEIQVELGELYKKNNINPWSGCAPFVINIIFVIWFFWVLNIYSCQMMLDGAQFFWINDVCHFNMTIIFVFITSQILICVWNVITNNLAQPLWTMILFNLIFGLILFVMAWFWKWPAYIFIFWGILTLVSTFLHTIIIKTCLYFKVK